MTEKTFKLSCKPAGITIVAGIDVHKHKLQVFVLGRVDREDRPLGEQLFGNDTTGRNEMCCFLDKYYPDEIVMEKTGKLSDPVLASIEKHRGWKRGVPRVSVVPPDTIKRFAGEPHTDPRSAHDLARLGISGLLNVTYRPSLEGQQLRELTRQAEHLTGQSTSLINEIKDKLSGLGYTLPDFTITSAWGIALLKLLLADGINGNIAKIYELIENGGVNLNSASRKALLDRKIQYLKYAHLSLSKFDVRLLNRLFAMLNMIEAFKASNSEHIEDMVNETPLIKDCVKVIGQIAGLSAPGAAIIAAEVDDMSRFQTCNKFLLYAGRGVAPDSSGEHVGKSHMTKRCNHHLKKVFKQAGQTACYNLTEDNDIRRYALRQLGKHSLHPIIACANTGAKIAKIVYKILHDGVIYDPFHDTRQKNKEPFQVEHEPGDGWKLELKEARRRGKRFRNFARRAVEELPPGEMKTMLTHVLEIFKKMRG